MRYPAIALMAAGLLAACASPVVRRVEPTDSSVDGIRFRQFVPYEISVYAVDEHGSLVLRDFRVENLPHPTAIYAVNYQGALVSSSRFKLTFGEHGSLSTVRVETTRTLKDAAEAAQNVTDQVLKLRKAEREEREAERKGKETLEQLKAIKEFREAYKAATSVPAAPGEPRLPDGSSLPARK